MSSRSSSSKSGSSSKSSRPQTAAQLRTSERLKYVTSLLKSHAGYLAQPILSISASLSLTAMEVLAGLAIIYFALHLILPAFLLPHLSASVTLIIPIKNTLLSVAKDTAGKKNEDCAQWSWYWVVYCLASIMRGIAGILFPGWLAGYEIIRTGALICIGGPWFGYAGLNPPPPSEELAKAEKLEAATEKAEQAKEDQAKAKAEKKKAEEEKAKAKAKAKEREKAKAKDGKGQ